MSAKTVFSTALVLTAVSFGAACGQTPHGGLNPLDTLPPPTPVTPAPGGLPAQPLNLQPSRWIRGDKYECCSSPGGDGPIGYELFTRIGPSVVLGHGQQLSDVLQTGLYMGLGGRALFFDTSMESAWTFELGVANIYNHAHSDPHGIALNILVPSAINAAIPPTQVFFGRDKGVPGVTVQDLSRTFFDVGGGKEWYLLGSANCSGPNFRIGCDGGGRYGTSSVSFHEIPHRPDVIAGMWVAAHADFEFPCCGCCILVAGFRLEYGYTWSDILQIQNNSDTQDLNLLFNCGIRF
jgi:hypothetical protein